MTTTPASITLDGVEYVRADSVRTAPDLNSEVRIVVLQRGWVVIGRYREDGTKVHLADAHVIERWGTTEGIGQLVHGPTDETRLRWAGTVEVHELGVVLSICADADAWEDHLWQ